MHRLIVDEHNRGMGYRKISNKYNIHVSTIRAIIQLLKRHMTSLPIYREKTSSEARRTRGAADYSKMM